MEQENKLHAENIHSLINDMKTYCRNQKLLLGYALNIMADMKPTSGIEVNTENCEGCQYFHKEHIRETTYNPIPKIKYFPPIVPICDIAVELLRLTKEK